jgi:uncharacterized membrane protein HdeD (DUF308 family)
MCWGLDAIVFDQTAADRVREKKMSKQSPSRSSILMASGVFLIIFGILAILSPVTTGGAVVKIVAVVLLVTGIVRLVQAVRSQRKAETVMSSILGAVIVGLGILVWFNPELGSGFLTILLTIFFLAHGLWKISSAFQYRQYAAWGWMLLSGVISLALAWSMWRQWPLSGEWAIGILVGCDLLLTGLATIMLALAIKKVRSAVVVDTINL